MQCSTRRARPPSTALGARPRACARGDPAPPSAPTPPGTKPTRSRGGCRDQCGARRHGLAMLRELAAQPGPVNVMTHCNAGALATCGFGTATAPLFLAHAEGLPCTAGSQRDAAEDAGRESHRMGARCSTDTAHAVRRQRERPADAPRRRRCRDRRRDRVARNGDVCNKIGTYDKALAARDNGVPFCVALPSPTIDWRVESGDAIPIESRAADEVLRIAGRDDAGRTAASRSRRPARAPSISRSTSRRRDS